MQDGRLFRIIMITFLLLSTYKPCLAQLFFPDSEKEIKQRVFIMVGLEPEWVSTIGYTHSMGKGDKEINLHLGGSIKFAPLIVSDGAWRANIITAANWKMNECWRTSVISTIYLAHDHNRAGTMNGLGFELRAIPGHYGKKWMKGVDIGWQYTAITHIKHSVEARNTFNDRYPENVTGIKGPKDGWYGATANRFRIGFAGTRKLGNGLALPISVSSLLSVQKQGVMLGFSHA